MPASKLLLYNGDIRTMTQAKAVYHWIYVEDGIIKDLGMYEGYKKFIYDADKTIDLQGKTVLPGFVDSHVFLMQTGLNSMDVDLSQARSLDDLFDLIHERSKSTPKGEMIRASKFEQLNLKEKRYPTRYELDRITGYHPIWINSRDIHTSIMNSMAWSKIKLPHNLPGISRTDGIPNGVVTDHANAKARKYIYNNISNAERMEGIRLASQMALEKGITTVVAVGGGFVFGDYDMQFLNAHLSDLPVDVVQFFNTAVAAGDGVKFGDHDMHFVKDHVGNLPVDVVQFFNTVSRNELNRHNIKRCGSYYLDGTFGSKTAALYQPYEDDPGNYGSLYFSGESLAELMEQAHLLDMQLAIHAIGDRAIDVALDAYETVLTKYPKRDHRHRIEYFELPSPQAIRRVADMGLVAMMVPAAIDYWCYEGGMYHHRIGRERMQVNNPLRTITDAGIIIASGSDSDITEMNPFIGIHAAVNAVDDNKRLTLYEALRSATYNGAYGIFEEHAKGTLEILKQADLVVLEKNLDSIDHKDLKDTKVHLTIRKGAIVYERK